MRNSQSPAFILLILAIVLLVSFDKLYDTSNSDYDYDKLLPLAEQGDAEAQFNLGALYDNGKGVSVSRERIYIFIGC